jgi:prepilin-type N-terminal cleavage/methylation domain-containing protein
MKIFNPSHSAKTSANGFTLIELLVVIAIIAILASILFPVFGRARENARRSSCMSNLKQIGLGVMQYTQDYDERYPSQSIGGNGVAHLDRWMDSVYPYVKSEQIFTCPSSSVNNLYKNVNNGRSAMSDGGAAYWLGTYVWNVAYWGVASPNRGSFDSASIAEIQAPATTINVLERNTAVTNSNAECAWQNIASTTASGFVQNTTSPYTLNNTAFVHLDTQNVLFSDGHVKSLNLGALNHRNAAGYLNLFTIADDDQ